MPGSQAWLDLSERRRAATIVDRRVRDRFRLAHQLLRCSIAAYLNCRESEVPIIRDPMGKPKLAFPGTRLRFNLSHSCNLIAVALANDREVGIDVESTRSLSDPCAASLFGLAAAFDDTEAAALRGLPLRRMGSEVIRLWTLKEAFAKATGKGLALPLRAARFPMARRAGTIEALGREAGIWSFRCIQVGEGEWLSAIIAGRNANTWIYLPGSNSRRALPQGRRLFAHSLNMRNANYYSRSAL